MNGGGRLVNIEVQAEPESCRRTSAQLAHLGEACGQASRRLERQSEVGDDEFGGLSGAVYRTTVGGTADTCDRLAMDCARLADGLADYARGIDEVRRLMGLARTGAAPWLTTCDWAIWSPVQGPDPDDVDLSQRWAAWHDAVATWRAARSLEDLSEQRWLHVLGRAPAPAYPEDSGAVSPTGAGGSGGVGGPRPIRGGDVKEPVQPYDDDDPVGPTVVSIGVDPDRHPGHPADAEPHAERVRRAHADHKIGTAMAAPVPDNLPVEVSVTWAAGSGLGAVLGGGSGGDVIGPGDRDPFLPIDDQGDDPLEAGR